MLKKIGKEILVVIGFVLAALILQNLTYFLYKYSDLHPYLDLAFKDIYGTTWTTVLIAQSLNFLLVIIAAFYAVWLFSLKPLQGFQFLGFTKPDGKQLLVASLASLPFIFNHWYAVSAHPEATLLKGWAPHMLFTFLGPGIMEEGIFRGFFFHYFRKNHSFWGAAFGSSVLWSLMHLEMSAVFGAFWVSMLLAFVLGFPFAYLFEKGKNVIWGCMLVHIVIDSNQLFMKPDGTNPFSGYVVYGVSFLLTIALIFVLPRWIMKSDQRI